MTIEKVKESLLSKEARKKEKGESSFEVLVSEKHEGRGRSKSRFPQGHGNKDTSLQKCSHILTVEVPSLKPQLLSL